MSISIAFVLNDLWIGAFWRRKAFTQNLYICLLPCCCIQIEWSVKIYEIAKQLAPLNPANTSKRELIYKARLIADDWHRISISDKTEN